MLDTGVDAERTYPGRRFSNSDDALLVDDEIALVGSANMDMRSFRLNFEVHTLMHDPALARRLLRLFIELNKSGTSVVIATHDIALMDQYDARRLVLHDGRIHVYD